MSLDKNDKESESRGNFINANAINDLYRYVILIPVGDNGWIMNFIEHRNLW